MLKEEAVISVESVSKSYLVGHLTTYAKGYRSLRETLVWYARDFGYKAVAMAHGRPIVQGDVVEEFWALKDVSFEVLRGEVVGIIGRNGAGKSTLLKILSRITEPTKGRVTIKGRVASLLEVGTGFHPELTGRENIYLNGAILGMRRAEIKAKFDEIVDFAEMEKFLDTPVKRYSSGMYVRLAFAVAAHLEPEILIVDEVLAVGDFEFQKKCIGKMQSVSSSGRTVLFVSHAMLAVKRLCTRVLWIADGKIKECGETDSVCDSYLSCDLQDGEPYHIFSPDIAHPTGLQFQSLEIFNTHDVLANTFRADDPFKVRIRYGVESTPSGTIVDVNIYDMNGSYLWSMNDCDAFPDLYESREAGTWSYECTVPPNVLAPGRYLLGLSGGTPRRYCDMPIRIPFEITTTGYWKPSHLHFGVGGGPIAIKMLASRPRAIHSPCGFVKPV